MGALSQILAVATLITMVQNGKSVGTATGFFYSKKDTVYLVTNRHVVVDEKKGLRPELLRIRLHTDAQDLTKNVDFDIPLYVNGKAKWHDHPDYGSKKIDIAVIEIDQESLRSGHYIKCLSSENFFPKKFVIQVAEDVMVVGYPRGLSDTTHNLPLVRNAMISSAYGIDFRGAPYFLVDANIHPGMSGGPVLTKPKNIWLDAQGNTTMMSGHPIYFLGVNSATLNVREDPLGLAVVWYGYLIEEIVDSI